MADQNEQSPYRMTPRDHWEQAARDAADFSFQLTLGTGLRLPWPRVDALVQMPVLPGWLVVVGGRPKAGKSTFLRGLFQAWVELGKRVLYVGTEQGAHILRMLYAAARLDLPARAAMDATHPAHMTVLNDVTTGQAENCEQAIIVADTDLDLEDFRNWCRYAVQHECDAVLLDHFSRMRIPGPTHGKGDRYGAKTDATTDIKNMAEKAGLAIVAAAQMKNGDSGQLLGEYEVPGSGSWAETAGLRREADLALQVWKPYKPGVTSKQKSAARDDADKLEEIIQRGAMAVRLDAHRYLLQAEDAAPRPRCLLRVTEAGELVSWLSVAQGGLEFGHG